MVSTQAFLLTLSSVENEQAGCEENRQEPYAKVRLAHLALPRTVFVIYGMLSAQHQAALPNNSAPDITRRRVKYHQSCNTTLVSALPRSSQGRPSDQNRASFARHS